MLCGISGEASAAASGRLCRWALRSRIWALSIWWGWNHLISLNSSMSEHLLIHRLHLTSGYTSDYIRSSGVACGTGRGFNKYLVNFLPSTSRPVSNKVLLKTNSTNIQTSEIHLHGNFHIVFSSHQNNLQNYVVKGSPDSHKETLSGFEQD